MKIIRHADQLQPEDRPVHAAIGVFDGVHLGHQRVLAQAREDAAQTRGLAVVVTFDRHPASVLAADRAPLLIHSLAQKLGLLREAGMDAAWVIPFDLEFSQLAAEEFLRMLKRGFRQVRSISVGREFVFGRQRRGNVALLEEQGQAHGFQVRGLPAFMVEGQVVSSTRIREAISDGQMEWASRLLGRPYSLAGLVQLGQQLGRKLGFPTANIDLTGLVLPPDGVYAVRVRHDGFLRSGVLNIGVRPTVSAEQAKRQCEVHLLDFDGDLYGKVLEIIPVQRLRAEQRFPSLDELKAQIQRDIQAARDLL